MITDPAAMHDNDVSRVLKNDGVRKVDLSKFENLSTVSLSEIKEKMNAPSWAVRLAYNEQFGGVLICQQPGEGNRLHHHPDSDECWVILEGEWEWYIGGVGIKQVKPHDVIVVSKGMKHQIKCVGKTAGIRFAITKPDVDHIYVNE